MRLIALAVVAAVALGGAAGHGAGATVPGDVLITADRLFDGRSFREPGAVLVRGGKVVAVGTSLNVSARRRIELGNVTLLPGFVDLHVHAASGLVAGGGSALPAQELAHGVTTMRDLAARISTLRPARRVNGLRVLMAGPIVTAPGGYPLPVWGGAIAFEVRGPSHARDAVRLLAERGAAVIKIALEASGGWPMLSVAEVRAIVREAHRHRLLVTAHAGGREGVRRALAAGVDELAHAPCGATDEQLRALAARRVPVVATLHVLQVALGGCGGVARRLVELGGTLLYGTDLGNRGIPLGIDVTELRMLRDAGLTPVQALAAATSKAGAEAGLAPLGRLVPGAPADVIAVKGDARALGDALAAPVFVMAAGQFVVGSRG